MFNSVHMMPSMLLAFGGCLISGRMLFGKENVNVLIDCLRII